MAPLARPESVNTFTEEDPVANDGDQAEFESSITRSANVNVTSGEAVPHRPMVHLSSQLTARTLSGAERKQLNLWKRSKQSRTTGESRPSEISASLDRESEEVESTFVIHSFLFYYGGSVDKLMLVSLKSLPKCNFRCCFILS